MELMVNGKTCELAAVTSTYGELMKQLSLQLSEGGSTIVQVEIDGVDLTGVHEEELMQLPVAEIGRLVLTTGYPEQVALDTLKTAKEWVGRLIEEIEKTADLLRVGDEVEANNSLTRFTDGFQLFSLALQKVETVVQRGGEQERLSSAIGTFRDRITVVLDEIITTQGNQDWIMLADLLEYELMPILEDWQDVSRQLEEQLQSNLVAL
ncbi:hypothetical protein H8D51_04140 [bacterium]|nr:hypothetical protein [bacterium]